MNKAWKSLAALPLLACLLQAATPAVDDIPLPEKLHPELEAILRNAVQQSPRMLNQALDLEIAENDRIAARAGLLPSVSASASYYVASDQVDKTNGRYNTTKTPYSLSLNQPIFHWGERRNTNNIGIIQKNIAQGQYRLGYRLLAQELRTGYLRLIYYKIAVKRAQFYQQYVTNQLKIQEDRLVKKVISAVEISTARLNAELGQINLERTEFEYENAKRSFARLAGIGSIADSAIPDTITKATYNQATYESLVADFLSQKDPLNFEAFNLRQRVDIEKLTLANAKTRLRPKVNGVLALSQDEQSDFLGQEGKRYDYSSRYAGISVNWALFDGFASGAAVRNSLARRQQLENNYQQLIDRLGQDAQTAAKQINFSSRMMAIQDRQLVDIYGNLNTVQDEFKRGVKSDADVSIAQLQVYDNELGANNARIDYLIKVGDLLGTLDADPIVANLPAKQ